MGLLLMEHLDKLEKELHDIHATLQEIRDKLKDKK